VSRLRNIENAEQQDEKASSRKLHRCTLRIQRPKLNPIHVLMAA
jgi:hypothetical protein